MNINWFPGHMTKSLRMMDENIGLIDLIFYVIDARAPLACINPEFEKYTEKLPVIYILNKVDLADKKETERWKSRFTTLNSRAVSLDSTKTGSSKTLFALANDLCRNELERKRKKGIRATLRCMVIGVPNCGKSTLINNLCGRKKAYAENRAGVTRGKQWIKINDFLEVLDTPGTLYPKIENQVYAGHLAFIGSIRDEIVDKYELSLELLKELLEKYPALIQNRYEIDSGASLADIMGQIAFKRGLLLKGGVPDEERCGIAIIDDFRKGRLGNITLETCDENL